ncbi:MAG TPA: gamma-glutamyl-gamma-aminobutyrate hydrolase family protein [Pseudonocardiaceae bacterium]
MSRRPVIGIAGYSEPARWDIWNTRATLIQQSYVDGIAKHGARVVVLPPDTVDADVVDLLDGLVLPSGADIDPAHYGHKPHPEAETPRPDRDIGELLLLRAALSRDIPVLGVCRGLQLLAIVAGGSVHQHLPDVLGHSRHMPADGVLGEHEVVFTEGSLAAAIHGHRAVVNSHHHQGVADAGPLTVSARADDGLIEAIEDPTKRFVLGVQWHPEVAGGEDLFAAFVAACTPATISVGEYR